MMQSTIFFASAAFTPAVLSIPCSSCLRSAAESSGAPVDAGVELELPVDAVLEPELPVDAVLELEPAVDAGLELEPPHADTVTAVETAASSAMLLCTRITTSSLTSTRPPGWNAARSPVCGHWRAAGGVSTQLARAAGIAVERYGVLRRSGNVYGLDASLLARLRRGDR